MKKRFSVILIILIFVIGTAVIAYPFFSNWYNQLHQAKIIDNYDDSIAKMKQEELDEEKKAAQDYNESLTDNVILTDPFKEKINKHTSAAYENRLNINNDSVMGYIEIEKINVKLSIFHGTEQEVLAKGVGHLENTSLPIGGEGSHAVLSAHTGYSQANMFNDLIKLEEGDTFTLMILNEQLVYQVDQIKVVEPSDTSDLRINQEQDLVTLVTCTPYGINSHRLLVRGVRIDINPQAQIQSQFYYLPLIITIIIVGIVLLLILFFFKKNTKSRKTF